MLFGQVLILLPYLTLFVLGLTLGGTKDVRAFTALFQADAINLIFGTIFNAFYLLWNVLFFVWLTRISINNKRFVNNENHSVLWMVISWFIPVVQIFMPYRVMQKLFNRLNSQIDSENSDLFAKSKMIVNQWWILCILCWFLLGVILLSNAFIGYSAYFAMSVIYLFRLFVNILFILSKMRMIQYYNRLEIQAIARQNNVMLVENDQLLDG